MRNGGVSFSVHTVDVAFLAFVWYTAVAVLEEYCVGGIVSLSTGGLEKKRKVYQ